MQLLITAKRSIKISGVLHDRLRSYEAYTTGSQACVLKDSKAMYVHALSTGPKRSRAGLECTP